MAMYPEHWGKPRTPVVVKRGNFFDLVGDGKSIVFAQSQSDLEELRKMLESRVTLFGKDDLESFMAWDESTACVALLHPGASGHGWRAIVRRTIWIGAVPVEPLPGYFNNPWATYVQAMARGDRPLKPALRYAYTMDEIRQMPMTEGANPFPQPEPFTRAPDPTYVATEDDRVRFRVVMMPEYQSEKWASPSMLLGPAIAEAVRLNDRTGQLAQAKASYVVRPALHTLYEFKP